MQDIQDQRWTGSRLHQPQGNFAVACRIASSIYRPAHGFRGKLVKPSCWSHMMVLRPKPSGGHRTIGLTVAPLRVLSRQRRPLAQKWKTDPDAACFWGCQGEACDRAAWAHSIMVAAAKGGSNRRLPCLLDLASSTSTSGTTTSGKKAAKPVFQHDCCFVGAPRTKAGVSSRPTSAPLFLSGPLGPFFQGCSGATTAAKLTAGNPVGNGGHASRPTGSGTWSDDISGHVAGTPKMVQVLAAEAARFLVEGLQARDLPVSKGKSKVLIDGTDKLKQALLQQLEGAWDRRVRHGPATLGPICSWAGGGGRSSSRDVWRGQRGARSESGSCGRQGHTHSQTCSHWLECWVALGFGCFGLHPNTAPIQQSRPRPKPLIGSVVDRARPLRCWPTPRQGGGQRTSIQPSDIIDKWCWPGRLEFGKALQTSTPCRRRCEVPLPGSDHLKRPWCGATDAAATFAAVGLERTVREAHHHTHDGTTLDLFAVAPK